MKSFPGIVSFSVCIVLYLASTGTLLEVSFWRQLGDVSLAFARELSGVAVQAASILL